MTLAQVVPRARVARRPRMAYVVGGASGLAWVVLVAVRARPHDMAGGSVEPWTSAWVAMWLLMVAAMMWPLATPMLDAVRRSAYPHWRTGLVLVCLATTTVLWLAFGLAAATLARLLQVPEAAASWPAGFLILAIALTRSARRARVLWLCLTLPPLAPGGRRGLASSVRGGLVTWRRCALLCGPVMTGMVVAHDIVLLACTSLAAWWEAAHPRRRHDPVPPLLLVGALLWLVVPRV